MSMVKLENISYNLRYFLFEKGLTIKQFASLIGESPSTLLTVVKAKTKKANERLCLKIASEIGVDLLTLQTAQLDSVKTGETSHVIPYVCCDTLAASSSKKILQQSYSSNNKAMDADCFAISVNNQLAFPPIISCGSTVIIKPLDLKSVNDGDTLLLRKGVDTFFSILSVNSNNKTAIYSLLGNDLQVKNACITSDFNKDYKILGRVIEIRHATT